ncbi:SLC13 family permease [Geoglobus sp.]
MNLRGRNAPLAIFAAMLVVLSVMYPDRIPTYPEYVEWRTVISLAGLLVVTSGLRESGYLSRLAEVMVDRSSTERELVIKLCMLSAALGSVVTNDAAILVVVPLTLTLGEVLDVKRAVVLETISANVGSTLTPIGNPQNILIWHLWGVSFLRFVDNMLKVVIVQAGILLVLILATTSSRKIIARGRLHETNTALAVCSVAMLTVLVLALEFRAYWFVLVVVAIYALFHRRSLTSADWALVALFALMFVDLGVLTDAVAFTADLTGAGAFISSVVLSQFVSNVPAAVIMLGSSRDYAAIAVGVNIGGNGVLLASFANLITYRITGGAEFLRVYHRMSVPFLIASTATVYFLFYYVW